MRKWFFLLFLYPVVCNTKTYQHIGIIPTNSSILMGVLQQNGMPAWSTTDGSVELNREIKLSKSHTAGMVFTDFKLLYQTMHPGEKHSPLTKDINETEELRLKHNQNIFSLMVSSINPDQSSEVLYTWLLEGFDDKWTTPGTENTIRYANLPPGKYTLKVRSVPNKDQHIILEERSIDIAISQPFWSKPWAIMLYVLYLLASVAFLVRIYKMKKQKDASDEKMRFLINIANDFRSPLALIKAPLQDINKKEALTKEGVVNMGTAMHNINVLIRMTSNLIYFENADARPSDSYLPEHEQNSDCEFITQVRTSIENNMSDTSLTVDTICALQKMSRTSFYNKLKALTDQTPSDYIRLIRLNQAEKLLKEGTYNISEIAALTGLGDAKYFREVFKKHFGVSPSQYAKDNKEDEAGI